MGLTLLCGVFQAPLVASQRPPHPEKFILPAPSFLQRKNEFAGILVVFLWRQEGKIVSDCSSGLLKNNSDCSLCPSKPGPLRQGGLATVSNFSSGPKGSSPFQMRGELKLKGNRFSSEGFYETVCIHSSEPGTVPRKK